MTENTPVEVRGRKKIPGAAFVVVWVDEALD
jgi:hypothetical protein